MAKKGTPAKPSAKPVASDPKKAAIAALLSPSAGRPSALVDTRVIYCGLRRAQSSRDNLEQLAKLPDAWPRRATSSRVDLIYIDPPVVSNACPELVELVDPPFNSNRNYEAFWGETKEKRAFEDRHASTQAYIDYMRPRCVQLARVLKKTGSFYHHCDWHASHYVKVMQCD